MDFGHPAVQVENGIGHSVGNGIGYGSAKINIELESGTDVSFGNIYNSPGSEGLRSGNPMYVSGRSSSWMVEQI